MPDVLDFSKIEPGKMRVSPLPFQVRDGIGEMIKPMIFKAAAKGVSLPCEIATTCRKRLSWIGIGCGK